ncbi:MAG TPA: carotenoid 1,2-hydratase [Acidobacteria bacterium]|nr:carotenoid 1,2-hydratase [Acidobacteriota bacterium]
MIQRVVSGILLAGMSLLTAQILTSAQTQEDATQSWRLASPTYDLSFPRDHAAHPDYRIEWWYYTGNLFTREGRRFGYQLTFFRVGVDQNPVNPSQWTVRDLHLAHLAITDIDRGLHRVAERLNRTGVGWAGASTDSLDVWNEDWRATASERTHRLQAMDANQTGRLLLDLRLDSDAAPVLHGDQGFSQKGEDVGNASHYYSFTRLATRGRLEVDGEAFDVTGTSWMDHEFGSSFLEADQAGWDWFSIQLNDGTDLMVYTLRDLDGRADIRSSGTVVTSEGITHLKSDDVRLLPRRRWISSVSGAAYPVDWRIDIPSLGLQLDVSAAIDAQELVTVQSTGVTYWEGAVDAMGTHDGVSVSGEGYLEMTGYAGVPMSSVLR